MTLPPILRGGGGGGGGRLVASTRARLMARGETATPYLEVSMMMLFEGRFRGIGREAVGLGDRGTVWEGLDGGPFVGGEKGGADQSRGAADCRRNRERISGIFEDDGMGKSEPFSFGT
jgi:hypothetical protein